MVLDPVLLFFIPSSTTIVLLSTYSNTRFSVGSTSYLLSFSFMLAPVNFLSPRLLCLLHYHLMILIPCSQNCWFRTIHLCRSHCSWVYIDSVQVVYPLPFLVTIFFFGTSIPSFLVDSNVVSLYTEEHYLFIRINTYAIDLINWPVYSQKKSDIFLLSFIKFLLGAQTYIHILSQFFQPCP